MTILEIIKILDEYYNPKKRMSENLIHIYADSLQDLKPNILEEVVKKWIQEGKPFMPKVSELRNLVAQVKSVDGKDYLRSEWELAKDSYFRDGGNIDELKRLAAMFKRSDRIYAAEDAERFVEWAVTQ